MLGEGGVGAPSCQPAVRGDPVGLVEDLHGGCRVAGFDSLAQQLMRDAVVVVVDLDVVVDVDRTGLVLGHLVALDRKRPQGRPVEPLEQLSARRREVPRRAVVELREPPVG